MRVLVLGAGVIGLSCAVRLREAGYDAHVIARDLALETTSAVAAGLWYPYRALPLDKVAAWSRATYDVLVGIAGEHPDAGVRLRWGTELLRSPAGEPWWRSALPERNGLQLVDSPAPGYTRAWRVQVPVADTSIYLPWLAHRVESLGGTVTRGWLPALPERGVVVNCGGLRAGRLADDDSVRPVRGQVAYVGQVGLSEWWLDQTDGVELTYIVPREHDIVIGGTAQEDSYDVHPDADTAQRIVQRAMKLVPALAAAPQRGHRVGLRPVRPAVRLESVRHVGGGVVHCYGHGGAGITLSWGCADDVVAEVERLVAASDADLPPPQS